MKATIYINRHVVAANKKATKESGETHDEPAITINTYMGSIRCKRVIMEGTTRLIQNAEDARCSGATIWVETEFENLTIDGHKANRAMFNS